MLRLMEQVFSTLQEFGGYTNNACTACWESGHLGLDWGIGSGSGLDLRRSSGPTHIILLQPAGGTGCEKCDLTVINGGKLEHDR